MISLVIVEFGFDMKIVIILNLIPGDFYFGLRPALAFVMFIFVEPKFEMFFDIIFYLFSLGFRCRFTCHILVDLGCCGIGIQHIVRCFDG